MDRFALERVYKLHGDTQQTLADALGITQRSLNAKLNGSNGREFTQSEIMAIKDRYSLTGAEVINIFFSD